MVRTLVLGQDRVGGDAMGDRVAPGAGGFGGSVADRLAPGHDEMRRDPGLEEFDGVIEPRREERRRAAVVLGRAHDHDGVGRALLITEPLDPDPVRRVARHDGDADAADDRHLEQVAEPRT